MRHMRAKDWDGKTQHRYAHVKRDGMWVTLCKEPNGYTTAWTRTPRRLYIDWLPAYAMFVQQAPMGTNLYCELWAPGPRESLKTALALEQCDGLRLECFAVDAFAGREPAEDLDLDALALMAGECSVDFVPFIEHPGANDLKVIRTDSEGWVLKDGNLLNWRKVKATKTYDLLCIGFKQAATESKFDLRPTGGPLMIGAMLLQDANGRISSASGMTDAERLDMTLNPEAYVNKLVEVCCTGLAARGGLMHPRFVRVREDKPLTEVDRL